MIRCMCCGKEFGTGEEYLSFDLPYMTIRFCDEIDCHIKAVLFKKLIENFPKTEEVKKRLQEVSQDMTLEEMVDNPKVAEAFRC